MFITIWNRFHHNPFTSKILQKFGTRFDAYITTADNILKLKIDPN